MGFVYIWYDKKRKMYYIGCHWGEDDDGYICSSNRMLKAFSGRPNNFKRRILSRVYTNRTDLLEEEYKWLKMIKSDELGVKYYNIYNHHFNHWIANPDNRTIKEKISETKTGIPIHSEEQKKKWSKDRSGVGNNMYGRATNGHAGKRHSLEARKKMSKNQKGKVAWNKGKKASEEQCKKQSKSHKERAKMRCSCFLCYKEMSVSGLNGHYSLKHRIY